MIFFSLCSFLSLLSSRKFWLDTNTFSYSCYYLSRFDIPGRRYLCVDVSLKNNWDRSISIKFISSLRNRSTNQCSIFLEWVTRSHGGWFLISVFFSRCFFFCCCFLISQARMALNKELYHCGRENPPLLLLLDRRIDPITPLLTQWTYQV